MDAKELIAKCGKLKGNWSTRDGAIRGWYDILTLKDELKQEGMESVTSNDPRTGYNLGKHLMTSSIVAHKISNEELTPAEVVATSYLESYITKRWSNEAKRYRKMARQGFNSEVCGLMLATGWYAVFSMVIEDRIWSEVWNPIEVYPEFSNDGMVEVAHIYSMSPAIANRKVKMMGWSTKVPFTHNVALYDYWGYDLDGSIVNGIVLGGEFVKPLVKEEALSKLNGGLGQLPIFISPVGGLPDRGSIIQGKDWQKHFGESIVATNEELTKNYNKMLSFIQQLARTAAQPKYWEKSTGDTPILTEEKLNTWGPIFRMGPNDDIGIMQPPIIPVELRTTMFEYSNMLQRGLFPAAIFGNVQQQMSYLAMANIASSALQVLTPYMDAYKGLLTDLDNFHSQMILENNYHPYNFKKPDNLPLEFEFDVQADIEIPGYLIQRATVARMLDPSFRLSTTTVMDKMFPEVRDPLREQGNVRRDDAMMHPKAIIVDAILAYREQAQLLRDAKDIKSAELYEKLATSMEAELSTPELQQAKQIAGQEVTIPREVMPAEATESTEGLGRI